MPLRNIIYLFVKGKIQTELTHYISENRLRGSIIQYNISENRVRGSIIQYNSCISINKIQNIRTRRIIKNQKILNHAATQSCKCISVPIPFSEHVHHLGLEEPA